MKYSFIDKKSQNIINSIGEEYKNLLIESVLTNENQVDVNSINIHELVSLDHSTKKYLQNNKKQKKINKLFDYLSIIGFVYLIFGLIILIKKMSENYQDDSMIVASIIISFFGIFISVISFVQKNIIKKRLDNNIRKKNDYDFLKYQIVARWNEIEALIVDLSLNNEELPLYSMIEQLQKSKILSEQDVGRIKQLLHARNIVIHGNLQIDKMTASNLSIILRETDPTIKKLKKIV